MLLLSTRLSIITHPNMLRNFFSPYYWVTLLALSIASGLFLLESFRGTLTETTMIILPKTEMAVVAPGNAAALFTSSAFQRGVQSSWEEKYGKEASLVSWQTSSSLTLVPGSSALLLVVPSETRSQGEALSRLMLKTLTDSLSHWYNMATEIDFRIIDGPQASQRITSLPLFLFSSLALALAVTTAFFLLLSVLEYWLSKKTVSTRAADYHISPETFRPSATVPAYWSPEYQGKETQGDDQPSTDVSENSLRAEEVQNMVIQNTYQPVPMAVESVFQEEVTENDSDEEFLEESNNTAVLRAQATGKAPDNLPIIDELSPLERAQAGLLKADIDALAEAQSLQAEAELQASASSENIQANTAEPTQEDYKRRLNELLTGRM